MGRNNVTLDAGVAAILGESTQRKQARQMTAKEKYDAARVRATYDIERWLRDAVKREADRLGTSASQLATLLLARGLGQYVQNGPEMIDFVYSAKRMRPDALRIECDLVIPDSLRREILSNGTE